MQPTPLLRSPSKYPHLRRIISFTSEVSIAAFEIKVLQFVYSRYQTRNIKHRVIFDKKVWNNFQNLIIHIFIPKNKKYKRANVIEDCLYNRSFLGNLKSIFLQRKYLLREIIIHLNFPHTFVINSSTLGEFC